MIYIPQDEVEWRSVKIIKDNLSASPEHTFYHYEFLLPRPLADWDVFSYWERERLDSMKQHLKQGDVLFDIGAESGWCNLIYAQFVGPENMVLIEPTREFWPNIKATWEKNYDVKPRAFYAGLFSDKNTMRQTLTPDPSWHWPSYSEGPLIDRNKYQYIHSNTENVPEITIDQWVKATNVKPDALTMDVEGAELLVLKGAEQTLKQRHPKVWVSIHPDLSERDYGVKPKQVHAFMKKLGYKGEYLATDHEEHWYYE